MKEGKKHKAPYYSESQATQWLSWLAGNMQRHDQAVFLIEQLQPDWLKNSTQIRIHGVSTILSIVVFSMFAYGIIEGLIGDLGDGLLGKKLGWFGEVLLYGLTFGLLVGIIFTIGKGRNKIRTIESISWSWGQFRNKYKKSLLEGLLAGLLVGTTWGFILLLNGTPSKGIIDGITIFLGSGFIGLAFSGLKKRMVDFKATPNLGIQLMLCRAIGVSLATWLISGLVIATIYSPHEGLIVGLMLSIFFGLWFGGIDVIRHYTLRLLIYLRGYGPWNYAKFLDYAVDELHFMQRVGGGYIFLHRMLLEHFAEMEEGVSGKGKPEEVPVPVSEGP